MAPPSANLVVTKVPSTFTPAVGSNITFTITVVNNGPDNATSVVLTDLLPSGYMFVSKSQLAYNEMTGLWAIGGIVSGNSTILNIVATVKPTGTYNNTATVTAFETNPDPSDATVTVIINPTGIPAIKKKKGILAPQNIYCFKKEVIEIKFPNSCQVGGKILVTYGRNINEYTFLSSDGVNCCFKLSQRR